MLGPTVQFQLRIPYQAYDCTARLNSGSVNVFATTLGRGWALPDNTNQTAKLGYHTIGARSLRVLLTAELQTAENGDGAVVAWRLADDGQGWKHARGPIVADDLFLGTVMDGRRETAGWLQPTFDDSEWASAAILHGPHATVAPPPSASPLLPLNATHPPLVLVALSPIRRLSPRAPVSVVETAPGVALLDFGVNQAATCQVLEQLDTALKIDSLCALSSIHFTSFRTCSVCCLVRLLSRIRRLRCPAL